VTFEEIRGTYEEAGTWHSTNGESGSLSGRVTVTQGPAGVSFHYGDGTTQTAEPFAAGARHCALRGATTSGTLYSCQNSIVLEYAVEVGGRREENTDVWVLRDGVLHRAGVIRQSGRVIWFDAVMSRLD
jgi:hypothetical protein